MMSALCDDVHTSSQRYVLNVSQLSLSLAMSKRRKVAEEPNANELLVQRPTHGLELTQRRAAHTPAITLVAIMRAIWSL